MLCPLESWRISHVARHAEAIEQTRGQGHVPVRIERSQELGHLVGRHPGIDRLVFGQIADPGADFDRLPAGLEPQHLHPARSGRRRQHAQQGADQRGFAGSIAAQQRERLPGGNGERDVLEHRFAAVTLPQIFDDDCRRF